jgi:hypothetical protein
MLWAVGARLPATTPPTPERRPECGSVPAAKVPVWYHLRPVRRLPRILLNAVTAPSLLVCVGTVVLPRLCEGEQPGYDPWTP